MSRIADSPAQESRRSRRFLGSVLWNWAGVVTSLFAGFVLSPLIIRRIGSEGYGLWALSFALVDYYWFLDLGFRSATVKYVAHYTATGERERLSEVFSTSLIYAGSLAITILAVMMLLLSRIVKFFQVSPAQQRTFAVLLSLVTLSWCLGAVLGLFGVALEAIQRFDITNRISVATTGARALAQAYLLFSGFGIIPLAIVVIAAQILSYALNFLYFRKIFTGLEIALGRASRTMLLQMGRFGIHSFLVTISTQVQNQLAPVLIGHFLPAAYAGFYNLPLRLVQYIVEFVGRIGVVTNSNAAELAARKHSVMLERLSIYVNRYCLLLFMPVAIFLAINGPQFLTLWVGPEVARYSAAVLPVLLAAYVLAVVGQLSSGMLLIGMGRHEKYGRGMLAEVVLGLVLLPVTIPRYGIVGAAWVSAILMIANRAVYLSYLTSKVMEMSFWRYVASVYVSPFLSAVPAVVLSVILRRTMLPGRNWKEIAAAAAITAVVYYSVAFFATVERDHRKLIYSSSLSLIRRGQS